MVVCHYISNPMLINDLKFDLRIYVLLTSIHPLKIFIYDDGLVRFATGAYNTDKSQKPSRFVHLTNYSVNKFASNFIPNKVLNFSSVVQGKKRNCPSRTLKTMQQEANGVCRHSKTT